MCGSLLAIEPWYDVFILLMKLFARKRSEIAKIKATLVYHFLKGQGFSGTIRLRILKIDSYSIQVIGGITYSSTTLSL